MNKKILTTAKSTNKSAAKRKKEPTAKNAKPAAKSSIKVAAKNTKKRVRKAPFIGITGPYGFRIRADGTLETKEERAKRLARLEALTLRCFQMAYDNYHRK